MAHHYVACDLGAASGRVMLGTLDDGKLQLEEIHRFKNGPEESSTGLKWNIQGIIGELEIGLRKMVERGVKPASLSADSWGVDYVWLAEDGSPLVQPFHYRDSRTDGAVERLGGQIDLADVFRCTGIQFMDINTLYQLIDDKAHRPEVFDESGGFLNIGDYVNYHFSGNYCAEESLASTTQIYSPGLHQWSSELQQRLGLPKRIFPPIVPSGTKLGPVREQVASRLGLTGVEVVATCSHDTGAAVAAVPAAGNDWAYLSSGTWSLLGLELDAPVITDQSRLKNFTNEVGFGGTIRFLKNIVGLWIVQECRRVWQEKGVDYSYDQMADLAAAEPPVRTLIRPDNGMFHKPCDMPAQIRQFCRATGQPVPESDGAVIRTAFDSLAFYYRETVNDLESLTGRSIRKLHVVGGGSRDVLLNQLTADALNRPVFAGPMEATAAGNILIQAATMGHLASAAEIRPTIARSFELREFTPEQPECFDLAADRFRELAGKEV